MSEYKSAPQIRFKGFSDAWEQRKLGEISNIVGGGTPSTEIESYWNGNINWYSPAEIGSQIYVSNSQRKITELGLEKSSARLLPVGTVLFTSRAGIGNMAILKEKACTNQGFQSIIPIKNKLNSYFIFSRSNELKKYAETVGAGSTFVEVSGKQMSEMEIKIPQIKEQVKIADLFTNLDNFITLHQRKYDNLVKVKKSLLEKMFPKNSSNVPEIRFKGFVDAWEQRKLNEFTRYISSNLSISDSINNGKYNLYDANNIIGKVNCKNISEEFITIIKDGSGVGKVRRLPKNSCFIGTMGGISSKESNIDFVYCCLLNTDFTKEINGATIPHIYYSNYGNNEYYVPKYLEQEKIGELFTNLDNLITLHQRKLEKLNKLKKSMLDKMFI